MMMSTEAARADGIERYVAPFVASVVGLGGAAYSALNDPFRETLFPRCVLLETTGIACPACGATRATHLLLHGDLAGAWDYNALLVVLVPFALFALVRWWMGASRRWPTTWTTGRAIALGVIVLGWWVVRNLSFVPFSDVNL